MKKSIKDLVVPEEVVSEEGTTSSFLSDEELSKLNVFFATPCYGGLLTDQFFLSMFIDADIEFNADDIVRMLRINQPIVVGAYPKKTLPIQYAINLKVLDPNKGTVNVKNGAIEVLDASTGFFLIKREVIEKMVVAYPELHIKNDSSIDPSLNKHCYALFDTLLDPVDNRYLSEDYTFCRRWQKLGGSIWLDPQVKLNHVGSYTFEGDIGKMFNGNLQIPESLKS